MNRKLSRLSLRPGEGQPSNERDGRMKRSIEITVEAHQVTVIRPRRHFSLAWCAVCARRVEVLSPEQAAAAVGLSPQAIYRQIEAQRLHFAETDEGLVWVCLNSLLEECLCSANESARRCFSLKL